MADKPAKQVSEEKATPPGAAQDDDSLTLTKDELQKLIDENRAEAIKEAREKAKARAKKKKKAEQAEDGDDTDDDDAEEDPAEIISKAEARAARAEQEAAAAKKGELLAKVENKLNAYLAMNHRDFVRAAPQIMLHIKDSLTPDAKDAEINRLIESHTKVFVELIGSIKKPANGASPGGARNRMAGFIADDDERRRQQQLPAAGNRDIGSRRPFDHLNFQ